MTDEQNEKRDWRVSAVLITIWLIAIAVILVNGIGIPTSMLVLASAFFVFLLPAMHDLVIAIEKRIDGINQSSDPVEESTHEH